MTDTLITVQGHFSAWYPAERATVSISVSFDGPEREPVFAATTDAAQTVRASITDRFDAEKGPVTWWSSDQVAVWGEKPWNQDGKQLPIVYHSYVSFNAKFSDFDQLARWIEHVALTEGVTVGSTRWDITEARRARVTAEVRSLAVADAVAKATVFAQSVGLTSVRAIALADPGMLGDQASGSGRAEQYDMLRAAGVVSGDLSLKPENIEVSATVDARFIAT